MSRGAKFILGLTVALITSGTLQYAVGRRFHKNGFTHFAHYGFVLWDKPDKYCPERLNLN